MKCEVCNRKACAYSHGEVLCNECFANKHKWIGVRNHKPKSMRTIDYQYSKMKV